MAREEARRLAPRLIGIQFSVALCSPRQRARKTCELAELGALAGDPTSQNGITVTTRVSGPLRSQKERAGWNIFADGCPNGELPEQVSARADRLIDRLEALEGNVALFSHGHFSRVLAARWMGMPVISGQRFMLDTGTLSILQDDPRHPENRVISLWNAPPAAH